MFQESLDLSAGQRAQQCAPCSIIFTIKLITAVFMHDDNVSGLRARKYCSVSVLQRKNIYLRFFGPDWGVCEFHLFNKKTFLVLQWGLRFVVFCHPHAKISTVFFYFLPSQNISRRKSPQVARTVVEDFSKKPTADCCFSFLSRFPLFFFCQGTAAFQLSHNPLSIYLLHSNCDLSLCWTLASMWTPAKSMD